MQLIPDIKWYIGKSRQLGLPPRCPFANVNACPRYFSSLSLLGDYGSTKIEKTEDERLSALWNNHPLAPRTHEQMTSVDSFDDNISGYHNFCPEIVFDRFNLFATYLSPHNDEIDTGFAHERLRNVGATDDDPRWSWRGFTPQHYTECPLYSQLSHDWHKLLSQSVAISSVALSVAAARFDVFISHASEDKDDFVRGLAAELTRLGLKVWYDETTLTLGDSLRAKIDQGLACSDYGVVILSHSFFSKNWPQAELGALFAREMQGRKVILPIRHGLNQADVVKYSPLLADKLATLTEKGVEAVAAEIYGVVRPSGSAPAPHIATVQKPAAGKSVNHKGGKFSIGLGKRHRHLRKKILGINPRRMADFYRFEKVAQLEACERGEDEFPTAAIKRLREFFFISRGYLEEGSSEIFDSFEITCSSEECVKLLSQGFEPFLLCLNELRDQMMCYPVFHKEEEGFERVIAANSGGYFASGGGGKSNIMHLIEAIHDKGIGFHTIPIQKIDRNTWDALEAKTFYSAVMGGFLGPDWDARDCFKNWCEEYSSRQTGAKPVQDEPG